MKWNKVIGLALAVTAALCLVVSPVQAGIIITEGKVASEGKSPDSKGSSGRRTAASGGEDKTSGCELDEDGFCVQGDDTVDDVDFDGVQDIDIDDPEGWDCTDVGGGLQYCEPSGATGSSPGAGAGGSLGANVGMDGEASQMGGCQGGGGGTTWPALSLLLAGAALLRRRRVA